MCVGPGEALLAELDLWLAVIDSWAAHLLSPPTALFDACHIGQSVKWSDSCPDMLMLTHYTHTRTNTHIHRRMKGLTLI